MSQRRDPARGIVLVWTALLLFILVGLLGLSLDWGKAGWNVHELHNAADAGALAGAQVVKIDEVQARQLAILTAFKNNTEGLPVTVADNPANAVDGEVVLGRWIRQERRFVETDVLAQRGEGRGQSAGGAGRCAAADACISGRCSVRDTVGCVAACDRLVPRLHRRRDHRPGG